MSTRIKKNTMALCYRNKNNNTENTFIYVGDYQGISINFARIFFIVVHISIQIYILLFYQPYVQLGGSYYVPVFVCFVSQKHVLYLNNFHSFVIKRNFLLLLLLYACLFGVLFCFVLLIFEYKEQANIKQQQTLCYFIEMMNLHYVCR